MSSGSLPPSTAVPSTGVPAVDTSSDALPASKVTPTSEAKEKPVVWGSLTRKWPVVGSVRRNDPALGIYQESMAELEKNLPSGLCYHMLVTVENIPTVLVVLCGGQTTTDLPLDFGLPIEMAKGSINIFGSDKSGREADEKISTATTASKKTGHSKPVGANLNFDTRQTESLAPAIEPWEKAYEKPSPLGNPRMPLSAAPATGKTDQTKPVATSLQMDTPQTVSLAPSPEPWEETYSKPSTLSQPEIFPRPVVTRRKMSPPSHPIEADNTESADDGPYTRPHDALDVVMTAANGEYQSTVKLGASIGTPNSESPARWGFI